MAGDALRLRRYVWPAIDSEEPAASVFMALPLSLKGGRSFLSNIDAC
jgi:hypothetical protein